MKTLKHFALTVTIFCLFQLTAWAQSLSGTWYSADNAPATLTQYGSSVTGSYRGGRYHESLTGTIEGTFDGRTLRCTYRNREGNVSGSGNCYFTLNGNQLVGRWEGGGRSGEWVLTRSGGQARCRGGAWGLGTPTPSSWRLGTPGAGVIIPWSAPFGANLGSAVIRFYRAGTDQYAGDVSLADNQEARANACGTSFSIYMQSAGDYDAWLYENRASGTRPVAGPVRFAVTK